MDKSWMQCCRSSNPFILGVLKFLEFVVQNTNEPTELYKCPCKKCRNHKRRLNVNEMYKHLTGNGIMEEYTIWDQHGEASNIPSLWDQREAYLRNLVSSSSSVDHSINPTMKILGDPNAPQDAVIPDAPRWNISVVSDLVIPNGYVANARLSREELAVAHWCVMEHCDEAEPFIEGHRAELQRRAPYVTDEDDEQRIQNFHPHFLRWMSYLQSIGDPHYKQELHLLASRPQSHTIYSQCDVNGIKFVIWQRDQNRKTQKSGVMVVSDDIPYYGILEAVVELKYAEGMPVVLFKCKWYYTDPKDPDSTKLDHGLLSVNTSTSWYEDRPFILAKTARQVFYVNDPLAGADWKVVNVISHRGTCKDSTLARDETATPQFEVQEPYQEHHTTCIPISGFTIELGDLPRVDVSDDDDDDDDEDDAEGFNNDVLSDDEDDD
ncbi:hypothetical protein LguiA_007559 [Lonicera macranthoides]